MNGGTLGITLGQYEAIPPSCKAEQQKSLYQDVLPGPINTDKSCYYQYECTSGSYICECDSSQRNTVDMKFYT